MSLWHCYTDEATNQNVKIYSNSEASSSDYQNMFFLCSLLETREINSSDFKRFHEHIFLLSIFILESSLFTLCTHYNSTRWTLSAEGSMGTVKLFLHDKCLFTLWKDTYHVGTVNKHIYCITLVMLAYLLIK